MLSKILVPQFFDRGGNIVYHLHEADPECRTLRPGKLLGILRMDGEHNVKEFEPIEQLELKLKPKKGGKK